MKQNSARFIVKSFSPLLNLSTLLTSSPSFLCISELGYGICITSTIINTKLRDRVRPVPLVPPHAFFHMLK